MSAPSSSAKYDQLNGHYSRKAVTEMLIAAAGAQTRLRVGESPIVATGRHCFRSPAIGQGRNPLDFHGLSRSGCPKMAMSGLGRFASF
jgi:hypothetical protein